MMLATTAFVTPYVAADTLPLKKEALVHAPSTVSTLDGRDPAYVYRLTNSGTTAYVVSRVEASCGCLAATLASDDGKVAVSAAPLILPVTLGPGKSLTVRATVRLSELRPGPFHKTVTIWGRPVLSHPATAPSPPNTNDAVALSQAEALARIEMEGMLAQPVLFARESGKQAPVPISFAPVALGRVSVGDANGGVRQAATDSRSAPGEFVLLATPDPRLLGTGTVGEIPPPLTSSHPAVTVTPLSAPVPATKNELRTLRYWVRVAAGAPLGPFLSTLSFQPEGKGEQRSEGERRRDQAWRTASVLVTGEVVGDLSASPSLVTFVLTTPKGVGGNGSVAPPTPGALNAPPDRNLTRQVVLTAIRPDVFAGLTVRTDNPLVQVAIHPPATTAGPDATRCRLTVTLSPGIYRTSFAPPSAAPQGRAFGGAISSENTLQTRIILSLMNGQQIVLPVSVYRTAPVVGGKP
ncbi:MAG: DUF1573 domain-containing protein [Akkermansiaceae bacterium]|nr:DUF1573 domain-containing protein [Armatimonadota bacterium]